MVQRGSPTREDDLLAERFTHLRRDLHLNIPNIADIPDMPPLSRRENRATETEFLSPGQHAPQPSHTFCPIHAHMQTIDIT